jgi:hypothetical protein
MLKYPVGLSLQLKDRLTLKEIPETDIDVKFARDFDLRFANFWEVLSQRSDTLLACRSRDALRWHFGVSHDCTKYDKNRLWVLTAARNGNIDAYAVFQRRDDPEHGLKRMTMADFQACDWHEQYCAALVRRACEECAAHGIHVLENVGGNLGRTRIFEEHATYRRHLPGGAFFFYTRDQELAASLAHPDAWAPSAYDGNMSL